MEIDMTKKHVLAGVAMGALMLGATSVSAAPMASDATGMRPASVTHVKYKKHQARHHAMRRAARVQAWDRGPVETWNNGSRWSQWGPFGLPFAAAEGAVGLGAAAVGAGLGTAGAIVGGTTSALTGYPYAAHPYEAYGSYGYAPEAYRYRSNASGAYTVQGPIVNGGPTYGYAPTYPYPY
jgi:hypothetical protein